MKQDLDWFSFETKIRKMVVDLVEPTTAFSSKIKTDMDYLKRQNQSLKGRIDELEYIIQKSNKKMNLFDDIELQISQ